MADNVTTNAGVGGETFATDDIGGVHYPISKIAFGALDSATLVSGANPFPVSTGLSQGLTDAQLRAAAVPISGTVTANTGLSQPLTDAQLRAANVPTSNNATIFQFSTGNTSSVQLAAGATFAGAIETALDQPSISILMTSDQPMTVTVKQYIDVGGTRAVPDIVFYVSAGAGFARSFTLNGNYVQVQATNTGASATTTFSLNTAYGDLGDSDSSGIMPVTELPLVLTGAAAQTATVNNILTPTAGTAGINVSGYRAASIQVVSTGTAGTFIFEQSNDNVNWVALPVFNAALVTGVPITAAITASASQIVYSFPIRCVFLRLRIASTITGGSIQAFSRLSTDPWVAAAALVASNTAANLLAQVSGTVGVTGYPTAAASADALANPTVTKIDATALNFNGASWDRQRNNANITGGDTGAKTATFNGATQTNFNARGAYITVAIGAVTGTTPTMTMQLQVSFDGTNFINFGPASAAVTAGSQNVVFIVYPTNISQAAGTTIANLATGAAQTIAINAPLPRTWRIVYTIGGTTPSFTLTNMYVNYVS